MKTRTTTLLLATLLFSSLTVYGQQTGYEISGIEVSTPSTPKYDTDYNKRAPYEKWLEVEVEFKTEPEFTEELTFKYYVFFDKVPNTVFTGEVTHVTIPKNRENYSVMYVSPQSLYRLLEGSSVSTNSARYIAVQILKQGQLVAEYSTRGAPQGQWWTTAQNLSGYLLNKDETPFAPLVWDRYAAIKSNPR